MYNNIEKLFNTNPIVGKYCSLYHIDIDDAEFIYNLRNKRDGYLNKISTDVKDQVTYIKKYLKLFEEKKEIYYKIYDNKLKFNSGVTRLTELSNQESFNFESGVMMESVTPNVYLDAMFMCYRIGFEFLKFEKSGPWRVHKGNKRMLKLHEIVGIGSIKSENDTCKLLYADRDTFNKRYEHFSKLGFGKLQNLV